METNQVPVTYVEECKGKVVEVTVPEDTHVTVRWSFDVWPDGAPVTRSFRRNHKRDLFLPAGTVLTGVHFAGLMSGCNCFDFRYGGCWYSSQGRAAKQLLGSQAF